MKLCPICFNFFHVYGYKKHVDYCKRKKQYYKDPKRCLNPKCENIISYELFYRNKQKFCCRLCCYTEERRALISKQVKKLFKECPEIFGSFGTINRLNIKYKTKDNQIINLQSSYEEKVAIELDKHNIKWIRPSYINYIDSKGVKRKYYPDFYLPSFNVYLDPKNDYLIKTDSEKIRRCCKQNNIKVFILKESQLDWKTIKIIIQLKSNGL